MSIVRKHITVTGRVQGVFFRAYTEKKANELGVVGYVMNQPDGAVFIDAQAEEAVVKLFVEWCHKGSPISSVDSVDVQDVNELSEISDFQIKR